MKIECGITEESSKTIDENLKYLKKLRELNLSGNDKNKNRKYN